MKNKFSLLLAMFLAVSACGYTQKGNELTGQVKSVKEITPIICPDYTEVDLSLGVIRNGVGSVTGHDQILFVEDEQSVALLKRAARSGEIVTVTYDKYRVSFCVPRETVRSVEILK